MKNDQKRERIELLPDSSSIIDKQLEDAIEESDMIEFVKRLFPPPKGNPFLHPHEPMEPSKPKQPE